MVLTYRILHVVYTYIHRHTPIVEEFQFLLCEILLNKLYER